MRAAVIKDGIVVNVVELHDAWPEPPEVHHRWTPPDGHEVIPLPADSSAGIGWQYDGSQFIGPAALPATD